MGKTINAKELRSSLREVVRRVRQGESFTVLYRSRPAFRVVPLKEPALDELPSLDLEPLYRAEAVGASTDGLGSADHDTLLYGAGRG